MSERDELDEIVGKVLGGPIPAAPGPQAGDPACLPFWRFRPGTEWTREETSHVMQCARCQGKLAALWEVRCPGLRELAAYRGEAEAYRFSRAMNRHLRDFSCPNCALVLKVLEMPGAIADFAGRVAKHFFPEDLGFARAYGAEIRQLPAAKPLIVLAPADGFPAEVSIWEDEGTLHVHGTAAGDVAGKVLNVEIWDDRESYLYSAAFDSRDSGRVTEIQQALPPGISERIRNGAVAVAWVGDAGGGSL